MIDIQRVRENVHGHTLVREIGAVPKGHVRIETGFLYPDGGSVDVFVVEEDPLFARFKLSDLGQTMAWLLDMQVRPWLSKKRQAIVEDAIRLYGVRLAGGALELPLADMAELVDGIVRLGQACVRVADVAYTRRSSLQLAFTEEVEEVLADAGLRYQPNCELQGRFGKLVRVDFLVTGRRTTSAVLGLSAQNASQAHNQAVEIFRRWYDLNDAARTEQRVTVFDDRFDTYREDDLRRIEVVSNLVPASDRERFRDLVAA